jgi:hypothetical protein
MDHRLRFHESERDGWDAPRILQDRDVGVARLRDRAASVRLQVETDEFLDQEVDEQPPANGQLAAERVQHTDGKRGHGEVGENFHEPSFL